MRTFTKNEQRKFINLFNEGKSFEEIGSIFSISRDAARNKAKSLNLIRDNFDYTKPTSSKLFDLFVKYIDPHKISGYDNHGQFHWNYDAFTPIALKYKTTTQEVFDWFQEYHIDLLEVYRKQKSEKIHPQTPDLTLPKSTKEDNTSSETLDIYKNRRDLVGEDIKKELIDMYLKNTPIEYVAKHYGFSKEHATLTMKYISLICEK